MLHRDELDNATLNFWTNNFANEPRENNIYQKFQDLQIRMNPEAFSELSNNETTHIRIYMGLDPNNNAKLLAVPAYSLDATESLTISYADLFPGNKVYDLGSAEWIDVDKAKDCTQRWYDNNKTNELYKTAFLFPRADFIQLFERDQCEFVKLDFGLEKQVKPMVSGINPHNQNTGEETGVYDFACPCPPVCDKYSSILPGNNE